MKIPPIRPATVCRYGNVVAIVSVAAYFFIAPAVILIFDLADPALRGPGIPRSAWRWHRSLTPRYAQWARGRVASGRAADLPKRDVSSTEWPLFGSVFYLLATEALQKDWQAHPTGVAPAVYAREAIDAAAALVTDPAHAGWVRKYWGDDYLHKENCFYRMLVISAVTSHAKLTGSAEYLPLLRDQVETLSATITKSAFGWIDDYPNDCYPTDVLAAIAAIRRADAVLGTDHSEFAARALRGYQGKWLDTQTGLPPYMGDAVTGTPEGPARGCANSYMAIFGPELWPDVAREWYGLYEKQFWQRQWWAAGFREWPRGASHGDWYMDVDSGPVVAGFGTAACTFGIGAARTNGRFDQSWPLAAEALVSSWPLPGGMLAGARILSNAAHAPYLGEAGMLFNFTRQPLPGFRQTTGGGIPGYVYVLLLCYLAAACLLLVGAWQSVRRWRRGPEEPVPFDRSQAIAWGILALASVALPVLGIWRVGLVSLLLAQFLPWTVRRSSPGMKSEKSGMSG